MRRSFPTEMAALVWRRDMLNEIARGRFRVPSDLRVGEAADELVDGITSGAIRNRSGDAYKPSVVAGYRASLERHVVPAFGGRRLGDVTTRDVQALVDRLVAGGANPSTVRNALLPLRVIYRRAVRLGDVTVNPVSGVELPAVRGQRDRFATPEEAAQLIAAAPERDRAVWATAFFAGLRLGELRALRWQDVDLDGGAIHVLRSFDRTSRTFVRTKSRAGDRVLPLPSALRDALLDHRDRYGDHELVFASRSGRPFEVVSFYERARAAWQRAGLESITLHEARHTFASLMAAAGVPIADLSDFMGHSTINVTAKRYRHLYPESRHAAAAALDAYLAGGRRRQAGVA